MAAAMLGMSPALAADPPAPSARCSVADGKPCAPSYRSLGQPLRLTVHSRGAEGRAPKGPVTSLYDLYDALRACWQPPPLNEIMRGMEMSVRLSFAAGGDLFAAPRVTYTHREADPDSRRLFGAAIDAAIARCTPMPFSGGIGAVISGRAINIHFIDDRESKN
jgi:hypothetical protein